MDDDASAQRFLRSFRGFDRQAIFVRPTVLLSSACKSGAISCAANTWILNLPSLALNTALAETSVPSKVVSGVLPDLSKFPIMEDVTRGVNIEWYPPPHIHRAPPANVLGALSVLGYYGLPMLVLTFIILKNKEVAP